MIAFDAGAKNTSNTASPSWSHTCSGLNRILWVGIVGGFTVDNVSGVTYNSVAMTQAVKVANFGSGNRYCYLYYLVNPDTGTNTVQVTTTSSDCVGCCSTSYTGVKQTDQPDQTTSNTGSAASLSTSIITVADNCFVVNFTWCFSKQVTAGSGATATVTTASDNQPGMFDSGSPVTPEGSTSMTINASGSNSIESLVASFSPLLTPPGGAFLYNFIR